MKKITVLWWRILRFFWAKDTNMIFQGIKKWKISWIIKWYKNRYFEIKDLIKYLLKWFKNYSIDNNKINLLKKWLDENSIKIINDILYNIKYLSKNIDKDFINFDKLKVDSRHNPYKIQKFLYNLRKNNSYKLSKPNYICWTFYSKHWIYEIKNIKEKVKGKDCIDCWAYIWDSAVLFLKELNFNKIFALEPEKNNFIFLKKTIKLNKAEWKIIPLKYWLWKKEEVLRINNNWITSILWINSWEKIRIKIIDNIVKEKNINPWLIKWDIEGFEYESILWAEKTIKKYKPILIISIYHRWKDFFEIKPLLESWNLGYKFKIVRTKPTDPLIDTVLICY